jgi:hypothetical protein
MTHLFGIEKCDGECGVKVDHKTLQHLLKLLLIVMVVVGVMLVVAVNPW